MEVTTAHSNIPSKDTTVFWTRGPQYESARCRDASGEIGTEVSNISKDVAHQFHITAGSHSLLGESP